MMDGDPDKIALRSAKGITPGRPQVARRGNIKSGSNSERVLNGFPAIALLIANCDAFKYFTTNTSPWFFLTLRMCCTKFESCLRRPLNLVSFGKEAESNLHPNFLTNSGNSNKLPSDTIGVVIRLSLKDL